MVNRSKLAVILHADVVGSTSLVQQDERVAHERIQGVFRRFAQRISDYSGKTHELRGDALVAEFDRASDAVCASLAFQSENQAANQTLPDGIRPALRIGIALGEVIIADHTITGAGVVLAQRLEQMAPVGGICVSAAIREAVPARLHVAFQELGRREAKGFEELVLAFSVSLPPGTTVPGPDPLLSPVTGRPSRRAMVAGTAVIVLLTAGVMAWLSPWIGMTNTLGPDRLAPPDPGKPSIAVLPFDNLSEGSANDYFADGLTDDLITDLSKVSGLFVIARNSTFSFKGEAATATDVARLLGVRYIVEGSVRRAGNRVRVNAQLVDGRSGHHLWAERYDRDLVDLFATQDDLVSRIVSALAVRLTPFEEVKLARRQVPTFEAYDLYLQARDGHLSRDEQRMARSLGLYEQAWSIDPTFARPYGGYARLAADVWRFGAVRGALGATGALARATAEAAAKQALSIDPDLPDAHLALALMRMKDGAHEAALDSARRAVASDPNSADGHFVLGIVEGFAGQPASALSSIQTAMRLNPRPPPELLTYYGWTLFLNRRYDDSVEVLAPLAAETRDRGIGESPREFLAMAYAETGRLDLARAQVASLRAQEPFLNLAYYRVAYGHHARKQDLESHLEALRKADMPEWPLGFQGDPKLRLTAAEVQRLVSGTTWQGRDAARDLDFIQEFPDSGGTVYASSTTILTGSVIVQGDELCESYAGFLWGKTLCGPIYHYPRDGHESRYVYVNPPTLRYFSAGG